MRILMICNTDGALYKFRKPIIKQLVQRNHEVFSITSSYSPEGTYIPKLRKLGVKTYTLDIDNSFNPWKNFRLAKQLMYFIKQISPDIVHSFTHKPAILGTIVAAMSGVKKRFITITGLGRLFSLDSQDMKSKILRQILLTQYRISGNFATKVFFQNQEDMDLFLSKKILPESKAVLTPGSGIDLEEFNCTYGDKIRKRQILSKELKENLEGKIVVLFPAKALREKGVVEFYNAAAMVSKLTNKFVFLHLGSSGESLGGISLEELKELSKRCKVFYLGYKDNICDYMCASDVVILPSFYGEGIPRALLEALALDKIVITTDNRGCREVVIDGWNGFLVEPKSVRDIVAKLLNLEMLDLSMFRGRSYKLAKIFFSSKIVVDITFKYYFGAEIES